MTREEVRKAAEVMMAYAEGKEIECKLKDEEDVPWRTITVALEDDECSFNWKEFDYRIKKEPTYRPFKNAEECWNEMQKHQPFGWVKRKEKQIYETSNIIDNSGVGGLSLDVMYGGYTFADGTPFGVKEDE